MFHDTQWWQGTEKQAHLYSVGGAINWCNIFGGLFGDTYQSEYACLLPSSVTFRNLFTYSIFSHKHKDS